MVNEWRNKKYPQLFTAVDRYSGYIFALPQAKQDGAYQVKWMVALLKHLETIGAREPRVISSGEEFAEAMEKHNMKHVLARSYNPQANGAIERANRTLKQQALTSYADAHGTRKSWANKEILDQVLAVLNTSYRRKLGMGRNAYSVLTGKEPDKDVNERIQNDSQSRRNELQGVRHGTGSLPEGTFVKVPMRVDGPSSVKDLIKGGQRESYSPSNIHG
jgi:hypothetical protein